MITKAPPTTNQPPTMSVEQFERYAAATDNRCELIQGRLYEMPPPGELHGYVTGKLFALVAHHVTERDLGAMYTESGYRLHQSDEEPTVRAPDMAFIKKDRLTEPPSRSFRPSAPDLAVETISPGDRRGQVDDKAQWWLKQGVTEVWLVDPDAQTLTVHVAQTTPMVHARGQTLYGQPLLPGFELAISDLFA